MFFKLGYKTFSMYQDGDLTAEPLAEECRGIESIDEELESIELELAGLRAGKGSLPCRSCGVTLWEEGVFCPHCGERVSDEPLCHNCAHPVRESQGFCSQCGARVTVNEGVEKSD